MGKQSVFISVVHLEWYEPPALWGVHDVVSSRGVLKSFCVSNFWLQFSISMKEDEIAFLHLEINKYWNQYYTSILYSYYLGDKNTTMYKKGEFLFT